MTTTKNKQAEADVAGVDHARVEKLGSGRPVSDAMRLRIAELAEGGNSVRQIAAELGINPSTVTRHAQQMGVKFDRSATEAATAAKVADGRARRAELAVRLLEQAGLELDRLHRPHRVFSFLSGPAAGYYEQILPQPDPASRLAIVRAATTLVQQHVRLAEFEGNDDLGDIKSWFGHLTEQLGRVAAELDAEEADRAEG